MSGNSAGNVASSTVGVAGRTYSYDYQNRLVRIESTETPGSYPIVYSFRYDALGRRVAETREQSGSSSTRLFLYAGSDIVVETDETGDLIHEVLFGLGIDRVEYLTDGSGTHRFPLEDIRGSVLSVVDQTGAETTSFSYSAYGKTTRWGEAYPYAFTGRRYLEDVRLYDYRNRVYDPFLARFLQRDPIGPQKRGQVSFRFWIVVNFRPYARRPPPAFLSAARPR